jgi:hypothetical protein
MAAAPPVAEPVSMIPAVTETNVDAPVPRPISVSTPGAETPPVAVRAVTPRSVVAKPGAKRPGRSSSASVQHVRVQRQPGVMDRLRLGWLRDAFKRSL